MQFLFQKKELKVTYKKDTLLLNDKVCIGEKLIESPGEYEVGGIFLIAEEVDGGIIYRFTIADLEIVYLRDPIDLAKALSDEKGALDIAILSHFEKKKVQELISVFDPKLVILLHSSPFGESAQKINDGEKLQIEKSSLLETERRVLQYLF